MVSYQQK